MTESNGAGTSLRSESTYEHPDSIGNASPTGELEVRDPATGEVLPEGEVGEICVRIARAVPRLLEQRRSDARGARRRALVPHRRLRPCPRRVRVSRRPAPGPDHPWRREHLSRPRSRVRLIEHPDITEVAVVGVDHAMLGQEVKAYVGRAGAADRRGCARVRGRVARRVQGADPRRVRRRAPAQRDRQGAEAPARQGPAAGPPPASSRSRGLATCGDRVGRPMSRLSARGGRRLRRGVRSPR